MGAGTGAPVIASPGTNPWNRRPRVEPLWRGLGAARSGTVPAGGATSGESVRGGEDHHRRHPSPNGLVRLRGRATLRARVPVLVPAPTSVLAPALAPALSPLVVPRVPRAEPSGARWTLPPGRSTGASRWCWCVLAKGGACVVQVEEAEPLELTEGAGRCGTECGSAAWGCHAVPCHWRREDRST